MRQPKNERASLQERIRVPRFVVMLAAIFLTMPAFGRQSSSEFDGPGYRVLLPIDVTGVTEERVDFDTDAEAEQAEAIIQSIRAES